MVTGSGRKAKISVFAGIHSSLWGHHTFSGVTMQIAFYLKINFRLVTMNGAFFFVFCAIHWGQKLLNLVNSSVDCWVYLKTENSFLRTMEFVCYRKLKFRFSGRSCKLHEIKSRLDNVSYHWSLQSINIKLVTLKLNRLN